MRRFYFLLLILTACILLPGIGSAQHKTSSDSGHVYFPFNKYTLTNNAKTSIDELIYNNSINDHSPISIIGYADFVGGEDYNLSLSKRRADAVKVYLLALGFRPDAITIIIGKGKITRTGIKSVNGYAPDRRVDIVRSPGKALAIKKLEKRVLIKRDTAHSHRSLGQTADLSKLLPGQAILLDKIFFYPGRHIIREESAPALERLYNMLDENPTLKIRIEGHVCCIGRGIPDALDEDSGKLVLSTNRARAIREYLIRKGIDRERLTYKGFGKSMPIVADESTEEEADKNRRVEIRIIEK